jgi:hypothetical protein
MAGSCQDHGKMSLIIKNIILEFFKEDWSSVPTLIRHSLVYTVLQFWSKAQKLCHGWQVQITG